MSVTILDQHGQPLPASRPRVVGGGMKPTALSGWRGTSFDAADILSPHMDDWRPFLWSADAERNPYRDRVVARARDLERNDGWAKSGITRTLDNAVGAALRPISKPDYRALAWVSGNSKFDAVWAAEFAAAVMACYRLWANDIAHHGDAMRKQTLASQMWVQLRHKLIDGDSLAVMLYRPETVGPGRARYATSVQLVDPDRLSNPQLAFDTMFCRGGVQLDKWGAPIGYHIREAHEGDWFAAAQSMTWEYMPKETSWGRPIVIHDYEHERASQHRGGAGVLTPIMQRLKMLVKYDGTELDAAIINAIFAAYVRSPYDPQMIEQALSAGPDGPESLGEYQDFRNEFWRERGQRIGNARMTMLAPGEEIGTVTGSRPTSNFEPFEAAILRHCAAGMGVTYEQLTGDYSRTNYSSFRGASNELKKTLDRRFDGFLSGTANPIFGCFVEEVMDVEDMPMPSGTVPSFDEMRTAYARCRWLGPGRGWVDEVAEKQGAIMGMEGGLSTLEMEAGNQGLDWEENVHQRAIEISTFKKFGMSPPTWADVQPGKDAGDKPRPPGDGT
jgi:lambda family phage portal protein